MTGEIAASENVELTLSYLLSCALTLKPFETPGTLPSRETELVC